MRHAPVPRFPLEAHARRSGTCPCGARRPGHVRPVRVGTGLLGAVLALGVLMGPAMAQSAGSGARDDKSCASYGAGFQKAPGSESCIRVRSAVRVDSYSGNSLTGLPGQANGGSTGFGPTSEQPADPWKVTR